MKSIFLKHSIALGLLFCSTGFLMAQTNVSFDNLNSNIGVDKTLNFYSTGSTTNGYGHRFINTTGTNISYLHLHRREGSSWLPHMTFVSNGTVGIGTTLPGYTLDVAGSIGAKSLMLNNNTPSSQHTTSNPGEGVLYLHHGGIVAHQLRYFRGNLYLEKIDKPWGTNDYPNLHVGGRLVLKNASVNDPGGMTMNIFEVFKDANNHWIHNYGMGFHEHNGVGNGFSSYVSGFFGVSLIAGGQTRLRVDQFGKVGIGANSIDHNLQVGDGGVNNPVSLSLRGPDSHASSSSLVFEDPGGTTARWFKLTHNSGSNSLVFSSQEVANMMVFNRFNGNVGLGINVATGFENVNNYKLAVNGTIGAKEIKVENTVTPWPDYVFENDYKKRSLAEVETFINEHKHLPEVPSAAEVAKNGISLGDMDAALLKKVEELTLYLIEQDKKIQALQEELQELKK